MSSNNNVQTIPTRDVIECLSSGITTPMYIWGPPGIGKSDIVRQVCEKQERTLVDIRLSQMDPTDLRGIPMVINGKAQWMRPATLPEIGPCTLFFDEMNQAPPMVQSAAYQIILDGRIGEHILPKDTIRLAASNPKGSGMLGNTIPLPLKNRFLHLHMRHNTEDWLTWADNNNLEDLVTTYIRSKPDALMKLPEGAKIASCYGFPTPRSWAYVAEIVANFGANTNFTSGPASALISGALGHAAALQFTTYLRLIREFKSPEYILNNPEFIDGSSDKSIMWSIMTSIAEIVKKQDMHKFEKLIKNKYIPSEIKSYMINLGVRKHRKTWLLNSKLTKPLASDEAINLAMV